MFYFKTLKTTIVVAALAIALAFTGITTAKAESFFTKVGFMSDFSNLFERKNHSNKEVELLARTGMLKTMINDGFEGLKISDFKHVKSKSGTAQDGVSKIYTALYKARFDVTLKSKTFSDVRAPVLILLVEQGYYENGKLKFGKMTKVPLYGIEQKIDEKLLSAKGQSGVDAYLEFVQMMMKEDAYSKYANEFLVTLNAQTVQR